MMSIGEHGFRAPYGRVSDLQILVFRSRVPGRVDYGGSEIDVDRSRWSEGLPRPIYRINVCWHANAGTQYDWRRNR